MYQVTQSNMVELGRQYLRHVLSNMRHQDAKLQFGTMGEGIAPNYQITLPNGTVLTYRGSSHNRNDKDPVYKEENLGEIFTHSQLEKAFKAA